MTFNNEALMAAAAQMLQSSGPSRTPVGLGQILGGGMSTYMGAAQAAKQRELQEAQEKQMAEMRAMQMQEMQGTLSDRARQRAAAERIAQIKSSFGATPAPAAVELGSTPMNSSMGQPMPTQAAPKSEYQQRMAMAQHLRANGATDEGDAMAKEALQFMPKVKAFEKVRVGGKVLFAPLFDDGQMGEPLEREVAEKLEFRDAGGSVVGLDAYSGAVKTTLGKTATVADNLAQKRYTFEREKFNYTKQQDAAGGVGGTGNAAGGAQGRPPSGYRWTADGSLEAIPGGPAGKSAVATEGERKAATLLTRLQASQNQLSAAVKDDPSAVKPGLIANGLRTIGAEAAANSMAVSPARQRVEAAQLDILDAALTLGTGAAYTREQLEGYRKSYFPQIGDEPPAIKDKEQRLKTVIEAAKIAAGRAAGSVPTVTTPPKVNIPSAAANKLRLQPNLRAAFDEKYGAGAAASILGK